MTPREQYREELEADVLEFLQSTYGDQPWGRWEAIDAYVDSQTTSASGLRWMLRYETWSAVARITRQIVDGRHRYLPTGWGRGTQFVTPAGMDTEMAVAKGSAFEACAAGLGRYGFQYLTLAAERGATIDLASLVEARDQIDDVITAFQSQP